MGQLTPLSQPARINQNVYEAIENAIVRGELTPESEIGDRRLADMLQVSRTPVRDALHQLEAAGLVVRRGGVRWAVADFNERDVRERYEVRRLLEPMGLRRLAESWEPTLVDELAEMFSDFPGELRREDYDRYLVVDNRFHKTIINCTGNRQIIGFYAQLERHIDRVRYYLAPKYTGWMEGVADDHRRICAAIADRDLEKATEELLRHLQHGEERMIAFWKRKADGARPDSEGPEGFRLGDSLGPAAGGNQADRKGETGRPARAGP